MTDFILIVIAIILFFIFQKLSQLLKFQAESEGVAGIKQSITEWIPRWFKNIYEHTSSISSISNHLTIENPAGIESDKYKRIENIIKIYSKYLMETESWSEKEALIKARFLVYEFGEDGAIRDIDRYTVEKEKKEAEKSFYSSGVFEKDINDYWDIEIKGVKKISGYDLFAPIYDVIVKQGYKEENVIDHFSYKDFEQNVGYTKFAYYTFKKERAIITKLEKLGIIKKVNAEGWEGHQKYIIPNTNIDELKKIIYEGGASHGNDYFEERFTEGTLERLFSITYLTPKEEEAINKSKTSEIKK